MFHVDEGQSSTNTKLAIWCQLFLQQSVNNGHFGKTYFIFELLINE